MGVMGSAQPRAARAQVVAMVGLLMAASLLLRTGRLDIGYWIDEGISVGIASHGLDQIPAALHQDGSPPLYYVLLHEWITLAGTGEAATRSLSLLFAIAAVPVAWWAGSAVFGRRAGALAASGAALCPFLTYYAQETRMYSLVAVLSIAASAAFVLAFVRGRRSQLIPLGVYVVALLYTHNWGLFLAAGMAIGWLTLYRAGRVSGRDGALLAVGVALAYAPWVPTLINQALHTAAPWSDRPGALQLLDVPGGLFGQVAGPLLALAAIAAARRRPMDDGARVLLTVAVAAAALAFAASQVSPAWTTRYLAILLGPLLLALAAVVSRGARLTAVALVAVAGVWVVTTPPAAKSNVRAVADHVRPAIGRGDLVVSTQPEWVPALDRYLPDGVMYLTPMGFVPDPRIAEWRNGLKIMRGATADATLMPLVDRLPPGTRILLVTPVTPAHPSQAPWLRAVRIRTRDWRAALQADPHLQPIGEAPRAALPRPRNAVRAELFAVQGGARRDAPTSARSR
jgi:mannosyltransferase